MAHSYRQEESDIELARQSLTPGRIIELKAMRPTVRRFITANFNKISTLVEGSNRLMRKVVQEGEQYERLWAELALVDETEEDRNDTKEYYEKLIDIIAKVDRVVEERRVNEVPINSTINDANHLTTSSNVNRDTPASVGARSGTDQVEDNTSDYELQEEYFNDGNSLTSKRSTLHDRPRRVKDIIEMFDRKYAGERDHWHSFCNDVDEWISKNPHLSAASKLLILKRVTEGRANKLIRDIRNDDKGYDIASKRLLSVYGEPTITRQSQLMRLQQLKPLKSMTDFKRLTDLVTEVETIESVVKDDDLPAPYLDDTVFPIFRKLLPGTFHEKMAEKDLTTHSSLMNYLRNYHNGLMKQQRFLTGESKEKKISVT